MKVYANKYSVNRMNITRLITTYYNIALYSVIGTNRYITLFNRRKAPVHGVSIVVEEEKVKNPIWKQSMQLQMGRKPEGYTKQNKSMRVQEITINDISSSTMIELYMTN